MSARMRAWLAPKPEGYRFTVGRIREVPLRRGFEDVTVGDEASPQPGTRVAAR